MKARRIMVLLLVLCLSFIMVLAGCNGGGKNQASEAEPSATSDQAGDAAQQEAESADRFVLGETPLKFSFYGNYDWYTMQPWGQDPTSKWIQDNKKVTVEAISSGGVAAQKLNTMIVSNEFPDVIWGERGADVERLVGAGKLVALDPYLDKYPNLKKWAGMPALNMLRSADGKLYQFPNWYTSAPRGNGGYIVNKEIYSALGSPKLETFDDLYGFLKQVKDKYPNQIVPFEVGIDAQGIDELYSGFADDHPVQFLSQRAVPDGDKLTSIFTDPVFRETMQFASKLFREKLVTQDAFTQKLDQVRQKITTGQVAVAAAFNVTDLGNRGNTELKKAGPDKGYDILWPLHKDGVDKNKVWATQYDSLGWNVGVITTSAENPEGIFAYLDWLTGPEGERIIFWGPEGMYWQGTDEEGAPVMTEKATTDAEGLTKLMQVTDTFQWAGNTVFIDGSKARNQMKNPEDQRDWATVAQTSVAWKTAFDITQFANITPAPDSEEGITNQRVLDIFTESKAKALFAKDDAEVLAILDKAEDDAQKAGYQKLLDYQTKIWQENLQKLNSK